MSEAINQARSAFFSAVAPVVRPVTLKSGAVVYVRELTIGDVDTATRLAIAEREAVASDQDGAAPAAAKGIDVAGRARAAAAYLCAADGAPLFDQTNPEHLAQITASLGWGNMNRVLKAGDALNAPGDEEKNA